MTREAAAARAEIPVVNDVKPSRVVIKINQRQSYL